MQFGRQLVVVYNIDSNSLLPLRDHLSMMTPSGKESCNLYAITFSPVGMKKEWKRFTHSLGMPARTLSRDEFRSEFRAVAATFPGIFLQVGKDLFHIATTEEINRCRELEDLISLVQQRLSQVESSR